MRVPQIQNLTNLRDLCVLRGKNFFCHRGHGGLPQRTQRLLSKILKRSAGFRKPGNPDLPLLSVLCGLCGENCLKDRGQAVRRASFEMRAVSQERSSGVTSVRKVIAA